MTSRLRVSVSVTWQVRTHAGTHRIFTRLVLIKVTAKSTEHSERHSRLITIAIAFTNNHFVYTVKPLRALKLRIRV